MTPEIDFLIKITLTLLAAVFSWRVMVKIKEREQKEADEKFEFTMKLIEMRNRKIGDNNES